VRRHSKLRDVTKVVTVGSRIMQYGQSFVGHEDLVAMSHLLELQTKLQTVVPEMEKYLKHTPQLSRARLQSTETHIRPFVSNVDFSIIAASTDLRPLDSSILNHVLAPMQGRLGRLRVVCVVLGCLSLPVASQPLSIWLMAGSCQLTLKLLSTTQASSALSKLQMQSRYQTKFVTSLMRFIYPER